MDQAAFGAQPHLGRSVRRRRTRRFVNVIWDGGTHAFLLETAAEPDHQRRGIGRSLVQTAVAESRAAGCAWLHVDYEPHPAEFYRDACGFCPTEAGLLSLR